MTLQLWVAMRSWLALGPLSMNSFTFSRHTPSLPIQYARK